MNVIPTRTHAILDCLMAAPIVLPLLILILSFWLCGFAAEIRWRHALVRLAETGAGLLCRGHSTVQRGFRRPPAGRGAMSFAGRCKGAAW